MKNILISGGAGFIGSALAVQLVQKGYIVTVLDNLSPQIHGDDPERKSFLFLKIKGKVRFVRGSVTLKEDWMEAIIGQDCIIHLAAETGTGQSMYEIERYVNVNIRGTAIMLDVLANIKHNVKKVVLASSRSIYGEGKYWSQELGTAVYPKHRTEEFLSKKDFEVKYNGLSETLKLTATDENSQIHPSSVYGITKQNQEQLIMTVCPTINIAPVIFRYQNVYGPGQSLTNPYTGILSIFSTLIRSGKDINVFEDGKESRDFVYIDDVVDATILGVEKPEANGGVFNVGTGKPIDVITVANELIENYGRKCGIVVSGNYRLGDIRHNFADLTMISRTLGFKPKVKFEDGIKNFSSWVLTQDVVESSFESSILTLKEKGFFKE